MSVEISTASWLNDPRAHDFDHFLRCVKILLVSLWFECFVSKYILNLMVSCRTHHTKYTVVWTIHDCLIAIFYVIWVLLSMLAQILYRWISTKTDRICIINMIWLTFLLPIIAALKKKYIFYETIICFIVIFLAVHNSAAQKKLHFPWNHCPHNRKQELLSHWLVPLIFAWRRLLIGYFFFRSVFSLWV